MRQALEVRGRILGGSLLTLLAWAVACGTAGPNSPDADADWHGTGSGDGGSGDGGSGDGGSADGGTEAPGDTGAAGDTGADTGQPTDTGTPEDDACQDLPPVTWTLVPQDTNGMATPVQARASVLEGWRVLDHVSIRAYEFLNYYRFDHPHPQAGQLGLAAQLQQVDADRYSLHLAVSSPLVDNDDRPPLNLVLSVDTSGSMAGQDFDLVRAVLMAVAGRLDQGDTVSVVSWNQDQHVLLDRHRVTMPYDLTLVQVIAGLDTSGATNLSSGLVESYRVAEAGWMDQGLNRVLVVTDGGANLGQTDVDLIRSMTGERGAFGIHLAAIGVGDPLAYHDGMVDSISQLGQGPGLFVATVEDVRELVHDRFVELFDVAALDLALELTLPPGFERVDMEPDPRQGIPDIGPPVQHLAPNRSLVLQQVLQTRCPELLDGSATLTGRVTWVDPATAEPRSAQVTWTLDELLASDGIALRKAEAVVAYAEALKLSKSSAAPADTALALSVAGDKLRLALADQPGDPDLAEIDAVLDALAP